MAMESGLKARVVTAFVLVLVFGSGVTAGLAWNRTPEAAQMAEPGQAEHRGGEREARERGDRSDDGRRPLLVEQVGLTGEQKAQVDEIVENSRRRMRSLEQDTRPQYRTIIEETRAAIKEVLTTEQRAAYEALLADRDRKREEHRRGRSNSSRDSGR
ncbi:MAG: hypothetical protein BMS9Abin29_1683 [Gemmatimonadota bacterium]|nr:MAG: hypothetical protein BMS9Abin29_1683 [Gemmatimonadota bacterium]